LRRRGRRPRRRKPGYVNRARRERRSIHDRPEVADQRQRLGDWELDLMTCYRNSGYLITAVDRKSGYTLIGRAKTRHSSRVMDRIVKMFHGRIPKRLRQTFTFDNGVEFYFFKRLEKELGVTVYFADPYNSGQRGTNENTNGLIRQYFPKNRTYGSITNRAIKRVAQYLNDRPRKRLQFQSPKHVFKSPQNIAIQI
jgi:IS30 family transposase